MTGKQYYTQQSPIYSPNSAHLQNQNKVTDSAAHMVQLPLENKEDLHPKNTSIQNNNYSSQMVNDSNYMTYAQEYINHNSQQRNINSPAAYASPQSIPVPSNQPSSFTPTHPPAHLQNQNKVTDSVAPYVQQSLLLYFDSANVLNLVSK